MDNQPDTQGPPATSPEDEDPVWGDLLAEMFGVGFISPKPSAAPSDDSAAPKTPTRKRLKKG
jgi:hypothetical protein